MPNALSFSTTPRPLSLRFQSIPEFFFNVSKRANSAGAIINSINTLQCNVRGRAESKSQWLICKQNKNTNKKKIKCRWPGPKTRPTTMILYIIRIHLSRSIFRRWFLLVHYLAEHFCLRVSSGAYTRLSQRRKKKKQKVGERSTSSAEKWETWMGQ